MDIVSEVKQAIKYTEEKNFEAAEKIYLKILKQDRNNSVILSFLGLLYLNLKFFKKAEKYLEKAASIKMNKALTESLGLVKYYLSDYKQACEYLSEAVENNKNFDIYDKYVKSLLKISSYAKAYSVAKECCEKYPLKQEALNNLAIACMHTGKLNEAVSCAEQLVKNYPKYGAGWCTFGLINEMFYHNDELAKHCFKKALRYGEKCEAYYNLAVNAGKLNDYKRAIYYINKVEKLSSRDGAANFFRSSILFQQRKFKRAFKYYSKKEYKSKLFPYVDKLKRPWDGKCYKNETLLVFCDQGIGDNIMFSRYFPSLEKKFGRVKVYAHKSIIPLFKRAFKKYKKLEFCKYSSGLPHYDKSVILSNIPYYLKTDLKDIPYSHGYYAADEKKTEEYRKKYFQTDKFKVGICWEAGAAGWREQLNRTLNVSVFEPLFENKNVEFYSFQVNPSLDNYKNYSSLTDLGSTFKDFDDTAAALMNIDLLITVDTSVAHLAGALGVKTFMLLPYCPDWRWFDNDKTTEWYDSVRIFKQQNSVLWSDVINNITSELKNISSTR